MRIHDATRGRALREVPHIVAQVRRSSQSIGANIAEGQGASSTAQYRRYLSIALASAAESDSHLEQLLRLDLLTAADALDLRDELATVRRLTIALRNSLP